MAKRRIALYKGNYIGIESIYTVGPNGEEKVMFEFKLDREAGEF